MHEGPGASGLPRLPAAEVEAAVVDQLRRVMRAPEMIAEITPQAVALDPTLDEALVTVAMTQVDRVWGQLYPAEQKWPVRLLVDRVVVTLTNLEVRLRPCGIEALANEFRPVAQGEAA